MPPEASVDAAGLARLVAALEAAPDPPTALRRIAALKDAIDEAERRHVVRALEAGASLAAVGRDLGISRQAAHRRFGDLEVGRASRPAPRRRPPTGAAAGVQLTPDARVALRHALAAAKASGDPVLGGEHVLLGLLRGPALPVLEDAGVTHERARSRIQAASIDAGAFAPTREIPDSRAFLRAAATTAAEDGRDRITPELLLLCALADPDGAAARTLRAIGADPAAVIAELRRGDSPPDRPEEGP